MNVRKLVDKIKSGEVTYKTGDLLVLIRRKGNGYPRAVKDGEEWYLKKVENEFLIIAKRSLDGNSWLQPKRIHRTYFIPKTFLRNLKLEELLNSN